MAEAQKITFFEKKQTACPVCDSKFYREDLLSGGGRLLAGKLADRDKGLEAGQIVMTGTLTPILPIEKGTTYKASFSSLGDVTATFA